jgi:hypothetical protein
VATGVEGTVVVVKEVAVKEVVVKEVAVKEVAVKEVAVKEVAVKEVAVKEVAETVAAATACGHRETHTNKGAWSVGDAVPEKNMLGLRQASEVKKCGRCCKSLNVDCFATNPKTTALYSKCEGCRPKHNATANSSVNNTATKRPSSSNGAMEEAPYSDSE